VLFSVVAVAVLMLDVLVIVLAQLLMAGLEWLVQRTKLGLGMRALSFDTRTAALMGVPVDRVISLTFVIGSALAAAAGLLYASKYVTLQQPAHAAWILLGLKAFVAAVVGGIGNIRGAMLGGMTIGLLEFFGRAYSGSPQLADVYVFSLLILVLLFRPTGILGRPAVVKV
jgi:branched-chain amino acid transport system permease protein